MKYHQLTISQWQNKTFGSNRKNIRGLINHLKKEIDELGKELNPKHKFYNTKNIENELADCIILLIGLADGTGIDLDLAINNKMQENVKRSWKKPDKHGVIEHE